MSNIWENDQNFGLEYVRVMRTRNSREILNIWAWSSGESSLFSSFLYIDGFYGREHQRSEYTGKDEDPSLWKLMLRGKKKVEESGKEIENVDSVREEREQPWIQVKRVCKGERFHYLCVSCYWEDKYVENRDVTIDLTMLVKLLVTLTQAALVEQ